MRRDLEGVDKKKKLVDVWIECSVCKYSGINVNFVRYKLKLFYCFVIRVYCIFCVIYCCIFIF